MNEIVIIGSSNTDMVVRTPNFPKKGETLIGSDFLMNAGGKGANQAVTVARLGGSPIFICRIGNDLFGKNALELFSNEGIDISLITRDQETPSGIAVVTVNQSGENTIVVASGANGLLKESQIEQARKAISSASYVLMQLEIPISTVVYSANIAFEKNVPVILNPAPATMLPNELYKMLSVITPNEKEAAWLSGIEITDLETAKQAAKELAHRGVANVIITRGEQGALLYDGQEFAEIRAPMVDAVDTTAAGDVFNGALVIGLSEAMSLIESVKFACKASAISVTRRGAQSSVPYRKEID